MIVDVSKWEGNINWDVLTPALDFVIMRASIGHETDPYFERNAAACKTRRVPMHVFHYMRAINAAEAEREAEYFWRVASPHKPISYVVDVEGDAVASSGVIGTTRAFIARLRTLGAEKIGLYTGYNAYKVRGMGAIERDWLWIARYGDKNDGNLPDEQHRPVPCDLWQYTDQGIAPGINGHVDLNIIWGEKPMSYFTERSDNMAVIIGSARGDENGNAHGGQPGDQTGGEVSTQNWYKHSKGWRVFRAKNAEAAEKIAWDMQATCDNPHIGYDQYDRLTLYDVASHVGFNCADVDVDVETDCSALVRVCCAYAGIDLPNFNTETEPSVLLKSGAFDELTGAKYTDSSDYLRRGDILVTRTKGHTVVVLTDGPKAYDTGLPTLRRGDKGEDVREMQRLLMAQGFSVGSSGADGDFGAATDKAVKSFQLHNGLTADGVCGPKTWAALLAVDKLYTVTIRGLTKLEADTVKAKWPTAEVHAE